MQTETKISHAIHFNRDGKVTLMLWPTGSASAGIHTTVHLSPSEAREIARELVDAADSLPRSATAADLGIAA